MKHIMLFVMLLTLLFVTSCVSEQTHTNIEEITFNLESPGMSYIIAGETYAFDQAPLLAQTPVAGFMTVTAPNSLGVQLRMLPNEVGTYRSGEGPNEYRLIDVWFTFDGVQYLANKEKGTATITLTQVGTMDTGYTGEVRGTFSGTFVDVDGNSITVERGQFISTP